MKSPYSELSAKSFWRTGVSEAHPLSVADLYTRKFPLLTGDAIATAGSCFAQHVAKYLRGNGYSIMDVEPPPPTLPAEIAKKFGYRVYSARFGNIYTVRQLLQLARDAESGFVSEDDVWTRGDRFYDALRPNVEPDGFESLEETLALRRDHLAKVLKMFKEMNVFIFTLGLTEAWIDRRGGRVFPTAPGTIAGEYDPEIHAFKNFTYGEIHDDFEAFLALLRGWNPRVRIILTVSPVPLTATASDDHVLVATTYSKSVLRAVAGHLAASHDHIDYFPSYEMVASPFSKGFFYDANLRTVNPAGVAQVMRVFFEQHRGQVAGAVAPEPAVEEQMDVRRARREAKRKEKQARVADAKSQEEVICEELLLEAFAP